LPISPPTANADQLVHVRPLYLAGPGRTSFATTLAEQFDWHRPEDATEDTVLQSPCGQVTLSRAAGDTPGSTRWSFSTYDAYWSARRWTAQFDDLTPDELISAFAMTLADSLASGDDVVQGGTDPTAAFQVLRRAGWAITPNAPVPTVTAPQAQASFSFDQDAEIASVLTGSAGLPGRTWLATLTSHVPQLLVHALAAAAGRATPVVRRLGDVPLAHLPHVTLTPVGDHPPREILVSPRLLAGQRAAPQPSALIGEYHWPHHVYGDRLIISSPCGRLRAGRESTQHGWQVLAADSPFSATVWQAQFSLFTPDEIIDEFLGTVADSLTADLDLGTNETLAYGLHLSARQVIEPFVADGWQAHPTTEAVRLVAPGAHATAALLYGFPNSSVGPEGMLDRTLSHRGLRVGVLEPGARWAARFSTGTPPHLLRLAACAVTNPDPVKRDELQVSRRTLPTLTVTQDQSPSGSRHAAATARFVPSSPAPAGPAASPDPSPRSQGRPPR